MAFAVSAAVCLRVAGQLRAQFAAVPEVLIYVVCPPGEIIVGSPNACIGNVDMHALAARWVTCVHAITARPCIDTVQAPRSGSNRAGATGVWHLRNEIFLRHFV